MIVRVLAAAPLLLAAACGAPTDADTVTVYAAASLQEPFTDLGDRFEQEHPGTRVEFAFAGSSSAAAQLVEGAPGDIFAAADPETMDVVVEAGRAAEPQPFATNVLTIVTEPGNPERIQDLSDLNRVNTVICAPRVPCGRATADVAAAAGVQVRPVSAESSVTDVLTKVRSGQADAGVVYVTDARRAGTEVTTVPLDGAGEYPNRYPIAVLADAGNPESARSFQDLVTGPVGRRVLAAAGFGLP